MPFSLPTFNVLANVFHGVAPPPPFGPPSFSVLVNWSLGRRVVTGSDNSNWLNFPPVAGVGIDLFNRIMLAPAGTDLRGFYTAGVPDFVEVPAGSGAFYMVMDVADMAKGFPNEHRCAWAVTTRLTPLPTPIP